MLIRPRQEILDAWEAIARLSAGGEWRWGGRGGRNSISDAEQLLCLLSPATKIPFLSLDDPDRTADDVAEALARFGSRLEIPQILVRALLDYLYTYAAPDGTPIFAGGGRFVVAADPTRPVTDQQRETEVVDSYAISVTLALAALRFVRALRPALTRDSLRRQADDLEARAQRRLTGAMVGLLRSFTVHAFPPDSEFGDRQLRRVGQDGRPRRVVADELRETRRTMHTRFLQEITIGPGAAESRALTHSEDLFECGWSWGVVDGAPRVGDSGGQRAGVAERAPYLYFTAIALEAIAELFSGRTQLPNLLDRHQVRLADALQLRYRLTHAFWARMATFGRGKRWPVEDVPWQTTDGLQFEYYSALVSGMFVQERVRQPAADADLTRIGDLFARLANRSRITERATTDDLAIVAAHHPGVREPLRGSEAHGEPQLAWTVSDIAPLLLVRTLRLAGHFDAGDTRDRVLDLSDQIWQHMRARRIENGEVRGLWDQPGPAFPEIPGLPWQSEVSWYHTRRMIDALISAGPVVSEPPRPSPELARTAAAMLIEADQMLHTEYYSGPGRRGSGLRDELDAIAAELKLARSVLSHTPGVAVAVAGEALMKLHKFSSARAAAEEAAGR
ncbi:SCO2524 family protein [Actinoplanes sp. NPDC049118]|uniref:SCO2524 family protein n=1 Tax=Actinoplanes sp. NPDC049118 TaxID=3155769 RepID=UPI0033CE4C53